MQALLQSGRLRIGQALPLARTLTEELTGFRVRISLAGHDSYGAGADWREGHHDDLVLALGLACWWGERFPRLALVAPFGIPAGNDGFRLSDDPWGIGSVASDPWEGI